MVRLSVIIPFRDAAGTLPQCLDALRRQDVPRDRYEVIAIDNNSADHSADIVRQYPEVRLLHEPKQGAYAARNRGVSVATGDVLVFTDPDCVAEPTWLSTIAREMQSTDTAILLGGYVLPTHSATLRLLVSYENTKDAYVFGAGIRALYYGHTNNMAVRRDVFARFGPFVERRRGADTIFVRRVVEAIPCSQVRYCPTALVEHLELDRPRTYYHKLTLYGESRESYRHLSWTRPLTLGERVTVYRRTCTSHGLSATRALQLVSLLGLGLVAWRWGRARAQWHRLTRANVSPESEPSSPRTGPEFEPSSPPR